MNENKDIFPELTLTPNAAATATAPEAPSLTLEPTLSADDAAAAQAAAQAERERNAIKLDESQLTEAERKIVADFAEKIDITDSAVVLQYGAAAQKNIAGRSEEHTSELQSR